MGGGLLPSSGHESQKYLNGICTQKSLKTQKGVSDAKGILSVSMERHPKRVTTQEEGGNP